MTEQFEVNEKLFRAVYPPEIMPLFWKENGEVSSAVFKDKKGLSVERAGNRDELTIVDSMRRFFYGVIVSVRTQDCWACRAVLEVPSYKEKHISFRNSRFRGQSTVIPVSM